MSQDEKVGVMNSGTHKREYWTKKRVMETDWQIGFHGDRRKVYDPKSQRIAGLFGSLNSAEQFIQQLQKVGHYEPS